MLPGPLTTESGTTALCSCFQGHQDSLCEKVGSALSEKQAKDFWKEIEKGSHACTSTSAATIDGLRGDSELAIMILVINCYSLAHEAVLRG